MSARLEIVAKPDLAHRVFRGAAATWSSRYVNARSRATPTTRSLRAVAAWLEVAASRVHVVHGGSGRRKLLAIEGVDDAALRERIALIDAPGG